MTQKQPVENLQAARSMELPAALQFQWHAGVPDDQGMTLLASPLREELQEELGYSRQYMTRMLFLKGDLVMKMVRAPVRASSLKEIFEATLAMRMKAITFYMKAASQMATSVRVRFSSGSL